MKLNKIIYWIKLTLSCKERYAMTGTRHEEYGSLTEGLPFVFYADVKRSRFIRSIENNWHTNLEIQICTDGNGTVLMDGKTFSFHKNDIAVVNSNVIHYTGTDTNLTYSCLIMSEDFCRQVDINPSVLIFEPIIKSTTLTDLLTQLREIHQNPNAVCRIAKLNKIALDILIALTEHHSMQKASTSANIQTYETVKSVILYNRENYGRRITLDEIAKAVVCDKFALCREFKKLTGQTIIENLNNYRCIKAIEYLSAGYTVAQTASLCGFDNLSFFTRTFKKHIGNLPSEYKK